MGLSASIDRPRSRVNAAFPARQCITFGSMMISDFSLHFAPEVQQALNDNRPVVALESTIISHGMPFPHNLQVALEVEQTIRDNGAVPATIAILDGQVHVGLQDEKLRAFAELSDVVKCSRRDLGFVLAKRHNGATTVAATMIFAHRAGIRFFATGGIGGVHRGAESSWDVSADLQEFNASHVAVFSAGAKAILDLPKTLEVLETSGVPVIGFKTLEFPAFYTRSSGLPLQMSAESPKDLAAILYHGWSAEVLKGCLIANPIPQAHALDAATIEAAIERTIAQANQEGVQGKELTPFLLKHLNAITAGSSQQANRALVLNNAAVAAQTASAYHSLVP